jgi:CO/xanthine dehydrogenase Mo-binding subunit
VKPIVADTASIGFTHVTGGSRVTFATGMATVQATEKVIDQLKQRAGMIWDISADAVDWRDGCAYPAGPNAGSFDPLPLAEIAIKAARTGDPIGAEVSVNASPKGSAGRSTRSTSTTSKAASIIPDFSIIACRSRPTCR